MKYLNIIISTIIIISLAVYLFSNDEKFLKISLAIAIPFAIYKIFYFEHKDNKS